MRQAITVLFVIFIIAGALPAQTKSGEPAAPPKGIDWEKDFGKALKKAKKEKRPIMVAFILRGESANEQICAQHFNDPKIIELSRKYVCILAFATFASKDSSDQTASSDAMLEEMKDRVSLADLRKVEMKARWEYMESPEISCPQFLFLRPDGQKVLLRHVWMLPEATLRKKMAVAYSYFDETFKVPADVAPEGEVAGERSAVGGLLKRATDNNLETRREAMYELAKNDHPDVIDFLIKMARTRNEPLRRREAIRAMGQEGQVKFLPALHDLLKENDFQVRGCVTKAIEEVGLVESCAPLMKALKTERKSALRSLLIRAIYATGGKREEVRKLLLKTLQRGTIVDQITVLYLISGEKPDPKFAKPVLKCARSNKDGLRTAAYYVIGCHKIAKGKRLLKGRLSSERQDTKTACAWALGQLGVKGMEGAENPSSAVSSLLPRVDA